MQNGNNPTYRKVHSNSQFILPFTLASVLFHKFSPHPAREKYIRCLIDLKLKRIFLCKLKLPVQWVYDVLDVRLWSPLRVEHYKFATLHRNYEQNPMKAAHIDI
jgi:hypothetical protein